MLVFINSHQLLHAKNQLARFGKVGGPPQAYLSKHKLWRSINLIALARAFIHVRNLKDMGRSAA